MWLRFLEFVRCLPFINLKAHDTFLSKHFHQSTPTPMYAPFVFLMVKVFLYLPSEA